MDENTIRIGGKDYSVDALTLNEIEQLEETCGGPLEELDFRRAKVIKQVVFLLLRRDQPELTLEEVGEIELVSLTAPANGASAEG